jgi:hypothetical protein
MAARTSGCLCIEVVEHGDASGPQRAHEDLRHVVEERPNRTMR